jgi:hypothetical protein
VSVEASIEADDRRDEVPDYIDLFVPEDYAILPADPDPDEDIDDYEDYNAIIASPSSTSTASTSTSTASTWAASTSTASTWTIANVDRTVAVVLFAPTEDRDLQRFKFQMIIAGSTVGATIIVVTLIVAAIIYVCRHQKRSPTSPQPSGRTFIKYKNKSGVLYFSTPADPNESGGVLGQTEVDEQLTISRVETTASGETNVREAGAVHHYVVPIATSTPETPQTPASYKTRVYRWEDF